MKYLIKFNESEESYGRYFSFISAGEFQDNLRNKDLLNFTIDEIKKIRKYVFRPILKIQTKKIILITPYKSKATISKSYGEPYVNDVKDGSLQIRKLSDEWYLIYIRTAGYGSAYTYQHILCDSFRGVIQILKRVKTSESDSIFHTYLDYRWMKKMLGE